jgi:hypothetical protein
VGIGLEDTLIHETLRRLSPWPPGRRFAAEAVIDEVICRCRGRVRVHTPTEKIILEPGNGLTVLAEPVHQIENIGAEDAEMTLSYSSGDRKNVAE